MTQLSPMMQLRARFEDKCGHPLIGGSVFAFEVGTSTPKETYADAAGTKLNTHPIKLDYRGEADIFLLPSRYRFVVYSKDGVLIYDVDGVGEWLGSSIPDQIVITEDGRNQRQINTLSKTGLVNKYDPSLATGNLYDAGTVVRLNDGTEVISEIDNNNSNPNIDMTGWRYISMAMDKTYPPVLGSPVKWKVNPIMASFLYGISDPTHLDDDLNNFRGLNNPNAWDDSNIPIGAVAIGRNNVPFAYLSFGFGHDCVAYGVASITGGAGSCTGNPDVPSDGATYGYCSLAVGKNTQARGRISNAMGERCLSESMYSSTDGYYAHAGKRLPTHPDYDLYGADGSAGTASRAHGYDVQAFGNFAFAYGALLRAYNGAQLIGRGSTSTGSFLQLSKRGLGLGYNVSKPTIFCKEGNGIDADGAHIGFNTDVPMNRYDFRMRQSDSVSFNMESIEPDTQMALVVNGLKNTLTEYMELFKIGVTHPNSGSPAGVTTLYQNGNQFAQITNIGNVAFNSWVDAKNGFYVNGTKVIGGQGNAIPNAGTDTNSLQTTINAILGVLRAHGLIAT
ncbi:hypothetical protein [Acinetobacter nosocomialis]|uniref:hypothetical protein n=1 Tax=Acinetobacter nosocomialis TaxID=106654 RepID=UPI0012506765|nr:hypothetical protein [Acinetobacter nosocomialis]